VTQLADTVLPLIRTRTELYRWSAANAHGSQMHEAVDILETAIPTSDPADVYAVTHKALASAIKVIARADDSSGIIGDACRRLLDLHPRLAASAMGRGLTDRPRGRLWIRTGSIDQRLGLRAKSATTWAREVHPSLVRMCSTCPSAVRCEMTSSLAISRFDFPAATRLATSCSRRERGVVSPSWPPASRGFSSRAKEIASSIEN